MRKVPARLPASQPALDYCGSINSPSSPFEYSPAEQYNRKIERRSVTSRSFCRLSSASWRALKIQILRIPFCMFSARSALLIEVRPSSRWERNLVSYTAYIYSSFSLHVLVLCVVWKIWNSSQPQQRFFSSWQSQQLTFFFSTHTHTHTKRSTLLNWTIIRQDVGFLHHTTTTTTTAK